MLSTLNLIKSILGVKFSGNDQFKTSASVSIRKTYIIFPDKNFAQVPNDWTVNG